MAVVKRPAVTGPKKGRADPMKPKYLFSQSLVLGEIQSLRTSAGVGPSKKIKLGSDMHLFVVVPGIGLHQVEEQVSLAARERQERFFITAQHFIAGLMT